MVKEEGVEVRGVEVVQTHHRQKPRWEMEDGERVVFRSRRSATLTAKPSMGDEG